MTDKDDLGVGDLIDFEGLINDIGVKHFLSFGPIWFRRLFPDDRGGWKPASDPGKNGMKAIQPGQCDSYIGLVVDQYENDWVILLNTDYLRVNSNFTTHHLLKNRINQPGKLIL